MNPKTDDELRALIDAGEAATDELNKRLRANDEIVAKRVASILAGSLDTFAPSELRFAARDRCQCGAGMAYPLKSGPHGQWDCSAILLGKAARDRAILHSGSLPFSSYEVKSEDQPSQCGATTRGPDEQRVAS